MKKTLIALAMVVAVGFAAVTAWGAWTSEPYTADLTAGQWLTEIGQPRLRIIESSLAHPTHADGFVDKNDVVYISDLGLAGVSLGSAEAATDYINIGFGGIINLTITNTAAMAIGDDVYVDTAAATVSDDAEGGALLGKVLTAIAGTGSAVVRAVILQNNGMVLAGQNGDVVENNVDASYNVTYNDDAVQITWDFHNTEDGDVNDNYKLRWYFVNDAATDIFNAYVQVVATDVSTGTEDAQMNLGVIVAGTRADILQLIGASVTPGTDDTVDLGSVALEFKDLFIDGTANIDTLVADTADINAGTVDAVIGGTTPAAGTFTTVQVNTSLTVGATGDAMTVITNGTVDIATGATSATITQTTIDADDTCFLTALETLTTGIVSAQVEANIGVDVILTDTTDGGVGLANAVATADYTIAYLIIED